MNILHKLNEEITQEIVGASSEQILEHVFAMQAGDTMIKTRFWDEVDNAEEYFVFISFM